MFGAVLVLMTMLVRLGRHTSPDLQVRFNQTSFRGTLKRVDAVANTGCLSIAEWSRSTKTVTLNP
ncbi:hypothetical protein NXC24_PB00250 (plasmid) [Rhizobium sp. NXC24]|nr:hypothetical protein NXC24_PB00250 [Rhizobium sp. NXC24]